MRAGKVFLFLFILGFGSAVETAWSLRHNVAFSPWGCRIIGGRFWGQSFSFDSQQQFTVPPGTTLDVENAFGAVRVTRGVDSEVRVTLRKVVYSPTQTAARTLAERIRVVGREEAGILHLGTNRSEIEGGLGGDESGFETHLEVAVPPGTPLKVHNEHGLVEAEDVDSAKISSSFDSVRVARVAKAVEIETRHGDVVVSEVGGDLSASVRHGEIEAKTVQGTAQILVQHGDARVSDVRGLALTSAHSDVEIDGCQGDLNVKGENGDVSAKRVTGRAEVSTTFGDLDLQELGGEVRAKAGNGEVTISDAKGPVFAEASFNSVTLRRIAGAADVVVSHGGALIEDVAGDLKLRSSGDDVHVEAVTGAIEVEVERGGATVIPGGPLTQPLAVTTTHGGIVLRVPEGSRFELDATSLRGELEVAVPGLTVSESSRDRVKGQMGGGGSLVKLSSTNGDVRVEPGSPEAAEHRARNDR